jgi:branched-chain amino acid transport system ATP-binding protein
MLKVKGLNVSYGHVQVLRDIEIEIKEKEIVTIIGSNGAGKSTLLKAISGCIASSEGSVQFEGNEIRKVPAHKMVKLGMAHVPEGRQLFGAMTVMENLQLGAYVRKGKRNRLSVNEDLEMVFNMFPVLNERKDQQSGTLSGGEQQMLAIGRSLMSRPRLLLLDEPSMGLAPLIIKNIFEKIKELKDQGLTILLVEQDVGVALRIADRGYVMQNGRIVMHDTGANLLGNEEVKAIYFGERKHAHQ